MYHSCPFSSSCSADVAAVPQLSLQFELQCRRGSSTTVVPSVRVAVPTWLKAPLMTVSLNTNFIQFNDGVAHPG
eukprot:603089-Rhodomonas_salina.1